VLLWMTGGRVTGYPQARYPWLAVRSVVMRQLLPETIDDVDPLAVYPFDDRTPTSGAAWLMVNMVTSADGASSVDGVSGGLGGVGDSMVFRAVRASCDWIVAAAGTVRAERYGVPRSAPDVAALRLEQGRTAAPRLAVVTESLNLSPELPLFAERAPDEAKPLIITGAQPDQARIEALGDQAEWCHLDGARPEPTAIIAELTRRGAKVVLAEGGPQFNAELLAAGCIDELCLSISPHLAGNSSTRIVHNAAIGFPTELRLDRLLEHDNCLFARYLRR
jgi:riboflavin biosynthesis pyrimidine reductase